MSQYVQILRTGLSMRGAVRREGDLVMVDDGFPLQSKRRQVKRWGHPKYREISHEEFIELGGKSQALPSQLKALEDAVAAASEPESGEPGADSEPEATLPGDQEGEFDFLNGLNVDEILEMAATFDEETLSRFIVHEQGDQARRGVLEPLGAFTE